MHVPRRIHAVGAVRSRRCELRVRLDTQRRAPQWRGGDDGPAIGMRREEEEALLTLD